MDSVRWGGRTWALAGYDGGGLFEPQSLGINPVMLHTAAWRGFICTYGVHDERLRLERLEIGFDHETQQRALAGEPPLIDGVAPRQQGGGHAWLYDDVALPVPFTGTLQLGDRFIRELYVHMGFAPAWKFEEVHELRFEAGRLVSSTDRSGEMRAQRERAAKDGPLQHGRTGRQRGSALGRLVDWMRRTFGRRGG